MNGIFLNKIVDRKINTIRSHWHAKAGKPIYRVRRYGYENDENAWTQTTHLPLGKILSCFRRRRSQSQAILIKLTTTD